MVPPVHQEPSIMPINTMAEKEFEEKEVLCTHKKPKATGCVAQPQQEIKLAIESEDKGHDDPSLKESACVVLSNGDANGCSEGHVLGGANKEAAARSRLSQICSAIGWKCPTYEFEEHGRGHTKLFTCKATVHVETFTDTVVECVSEPKPQMRAAQEQGAQGVLWTLKCLGHVK
ncbi:Endoribonuclease Dicer-like protein 4 [Hordeum vulgare]|uniref:DRBM domain-containing protein n=1 Tax=Hordeum vulgare subsp. vulgare TaxID=112509 RepID=A0A8I6XG01_HORVV|nr:endoribonuclease Dicer homolog 4-like [Hordeum vulgare subsp. vulgare]KAE8819125.1 Endoribonuclease Dicer-like protein 4 [Hordeum vulgare]